MTGNPTRRPASTSVLGDLAALTQEWDRLAPRAHRPSVFLESDWMRAAWAWRSETARLHIVRVARGGEAIGFVPLIETRAPRLGRSARRLEFLEIPDTQRCEVLCAPGDLDAVCGALAAHLAGVHRRWDELCLVKLDAESPTLAALARAFGETGLTAYTGESAVVPGVRLSGGWEAFYAGRTRRLKKANNHLANRLKRAVGSIEVERLSGMEIPQDRLAAAVDALTNISRRSWKAATGLTFDQSGPQRFLRELLPRAAARGWLSLWLLRLDGKVAATELQLAHRGVIAALRSDYDPDYAELSAGSYLNWQLIVQLFATGEAYYCMGPGANKYKLRWADDLPQQLTLRVYNRTARGVLGWIEDRAARPALRRLLRRAPDEAQSTAGEDAT